MDVALAHSRNTAPVEKAGEAQLPDVSRSLGQSAEWAKFKKDAGSLLSAVIAGTKSSTDPETLHKRARGAAQELREVEGLLNEQGLNEQAKKQLTSLTETLSTLAREFNTEVAAHNPLGLNVTRSKEGLVITAVTDGAQPLTIIGRSENGQQIRDGSFGPSAVADLRSGRAISIRAGSEYFVPRSVEALPNDKLRYTIRIPTGTNMVVELGRGNERMQFRPGEDKADLSPNALTFDITAEKLLSTLESPAVIQPAREASAQVQSPAQPLASYTPKQINGTWVVPGRVNAKLPRELLAEAQQKGLGFYQTSENSSSVTFRLHQGNRINGAFVTVPRNASPEEVGKALAGALEKTLYPQGRPGRAAISTRPSVAIESGVPGLSARPVASPAGAEQSLAEIKGYHELDTLQEKGYVIRLTASEGSGAEQKVTFQFFKKENGSLKAASEPLHIERAQTDYFAKRDRALTEEAGRLLKAEYGKLDLAAGRLEGATALETSLRDIAELTANLSKERVLERIKSPEARAGWAEFISKEHQQIEAALQTPPTPEQLEVLQTRVGKLHANLARLNDWHRQNNSAVNPAPTEGVGALTEVNFNALAEQVSAVTALPQKAAPQPRDPHPETTEPASPEREAKPKDESPKEEQTVSREQSLAEKLTDLDETFDAVYELTQGQSDTWVSAGGRQFLLLPSKTAFVMRTQTANGIDDQKLDYNHARKILQNAHDPAALPPLYDIGSYQDGRWTSHLQSGSPEQLMRETLLETVRSQHSVLLNEANGMRGEFVAVPGTDREIRVSEDGDEIIVQFKNETQSTYARFSLAEATEQITSAGDPFELESNSFYEWGEFNQRTGEFEVPRLNELDKLRIEKTKEIGRLFSYLTSVTGSDFGEWKEINESQQALRVDEYTVIVRKEDGGKVADQRVNPLDAVGEISRISNPVEVMQYAPYSNGRYDQASGTWTPEK